MYVAKVMAATVVSSHQRENSEEYEFKLKAIKYTYTVLVGQEGFTHTGNTVWWYSRGLYASG